MNLKKRNNRSDEYEQRYRPSRLVRSLTDSDGLGGLRLVATGVFGVGALGARRVSGVGTASGLLGVVARGRLLWRQRLGDGTRRGAVGTGLALGIGLAGGGGVAVGCVLANGGIYGRDGVVSVSLAGVVGGTAAGAGDDGGDGLLAANITSGMARGEAIWGRGWLRKGGQLRGSSIRLRDGVHLLGRTRGAEDGVGSGVDTSECTSLAAAGTGRHAISRIPVCWRCSLYRRSVGCVQVCGVGIAFCDYRGD